jgi:cytochrome P450
MLLINKPGPLQELYVSKNTYVDKEEFVKLQFGPFLGESSLLIKGSEEQARKRKLIGSSFYKDKLLKMVELIDKLVSEKVQKFKELNGKPFNIIEELDSLHTSIILTSAFGLENASSVKIPFEENGITAPLGLGECLRRIFLILAFRSARYEISIIPFLMFLYYTPSDRALLRNIKRVRDYCKEIIKERRARPKKDHSADLLSILLEDELYQNNEEVIVDECITFFLAGSQTVKATNANILMQLTIHDEVKAKLMAELK